MNTPLFTNFGSALALVLASFMVFGAFLFITIQFVVALVESYIVVSAGFIFLGFGGSRWTAPYVERYIGLAVSVGTKIMVLYLLVGSGMALSDGWLNAAVNVPGTASPSMSALDIVGAALIFMAVCWQAPKLIAGVIGGSPSLTGGDLISTATTLAGAAYLAGSLAARGGRALFERSGGGSSWQQGPRGGDGGQGPSSSGGSSGGNLPGGNSAPGGAPSVQPPPPPTDMTGGTVQVSPPNNRPSAGGELGSNSSVLSDESVNSQAPRQTTTKTPAHGSSATSTLQFRSFTAPVSSARSGTSNRETHRQAVSVTTSTRSWQCNYRLK